MKEKIEFENEYLNSTPTYLKKKKIFFKFISGLMFIVATAVICLVMLKRKEVDSKFYEATVSDYEIYCENKAYILNNECVVDYDKYSTIITIAESNKRIASGEIIAMYKTDEYDNNLKKLDELNEEINKKLSLLSPSYSLEIIQVENEINSIIQGVLNTSSYIEMNEYKSKLDELAYKKAKIVASLDSNSEDLEKLINERDEFKLNMNTSLKNIISSKAGVVVYKLDSNENKFDGEEFNLEKIQKIKEAYDKNKEETFGIKIVDNFESYIIVEDSASKREYMNIESTYKIELLEKNETIKGKLKYIIDSENEGNLYLVFRITNGIENFVDLRTTDIKVIWKEYSGFWVNNESITTKGDISYITILSLNEYIEIPVEVIVVSGDKTLVKNYTKSNLESLGIERKRSLLLYDRIVNSKENIEN